MSYKSGLVIYSVKTDKKSNYMVEKTIIIHDIGYIPKGSGSMHIWDRIYDLADAGKFADYDKSMSLCFKVVPIEDLEDIENGDYAVIDWLKHGRD